MLRQIFVPFSIFLITLLSSSCTKDKEDLFKPSIVSFSPTSGVSGTIVNIEGSGFALEGKNTAVLFGEAFLEIKEITTNNIKVVIPYGYIGETLPFKVTNNSSVGEFVESLEKFTVSIPIFEDFNPKIDTAGAIISFSGKNFSNSIMSSGSGVYLVDGGGDRYSMGIKSMSDTLIKATIALHGDGKFTLAANMEGYDQLLSDTLIISTRFDFNDTSPLPISTPDYLHTIDIRVFSRSLNIKFTLENMELYGWSSPTGKGYRLYQISIPENLMPGAYKVIGFVDGIPATPRNSGIVYLE